MLKSGKNMSSLVNGSMPGDSSSIFLDRISHSNDHSKMISSIFQRLPRKYRDFFWNTESFLYTQLMNLRQKRLADVIRTYASQSIMDYEQMRPHLFGIISVIAVDVNQDYSYADIFISAQEHEKELPHFIAPTAHGIERYIGKEFSLRKVPHIRFKLSSETRKETNILELINTLDHQYGLSQMDT